MTTHTTSTNMGGGDPFPPIAIPWQRLRAWIDAQEAVEKSAPLPRSQVQALSLLIDLVNDDEPEMDGCDYVSKLHYLIQARKLAAPEFIDLGPVEIPIAGNFALRWRTICVLPHLSGSAKQFQAGFPAVGFGIDDKAAGPPMFRSKKVAKQYAAKHAHTYLSRETATPVPNPRLVSSPGLGIPSGHGRMMGGSPVRPHPDKRAESDNVFANSENGPSVFSLVCTLAGQLSIQNPRYHVEEDADKPGFFSGWPVFENDASVPHGLGVVRGVLGKQSAREQMADMVLDWLRAEDKRRREISAQMMGLGQE